MARNCGGCRGLGNHHRWCPSTVGHRAALLGRKADEAEALGDSVGGNDPEAANLLYAASGRLLEAAREASLQDHGLA